MSSLVVPAQAAWFFSTTQPWGEGSKPLRFAPIGDGWRVGDDTPGD